MIMNKPPETPEKDPAQHESPQVYAETWWRFHRGMYLWAWESLATQGMDIANPEVQTYPATISDFGSFLRKIEYHGALALLFVDIHSGYEELDRKTNPWTVKSITLGRDMRTYRPITNSDSLQRWREEIRREATADFLNQVVSLLDADYLLGRK